MAWFAFVAGGPHVVLKFELGLGLMLALEDDEYALLELVKMKPLTYIPPLHFAKAEKLVRQGILLWKDRQWYPTAVGMALVGANGTCLPSIN